MSESAWIRCYNKLQTLPLLWYQGHCGVTTERVCLCHFTEKRHNNINVTGIKQAIYIMNLKSICDLYIFRNLYCTTHTHLNCLYCYCIVVFLSVCHTGFGDDGGRGSACCRLFCGVWSERSVRSIGSGGHFWWRVS